MREKAGPEHFREVVQVNNALLETSFFEGLLHTGPGLRTLHTLLLFSPELPELISHFTY